MVSCEWTFQVLLPFVYFMVRDFGIGETENDVARFAGWIAGAYTFGQFLSGYVVCLSLGLTFFALKAFLSDFVKIYLGPCFGQNREKVSW